MTTPTPLTPEQQQLLDQWQQADDTFQKATYAYLQTHNDQVKAPESQRLKAFNLQRHALDAQVKAFKWLQRGRSHCIASGFDPETYRLSSGTQ